MQNPSNLGKGKMVDHNREQLLKEIEKLKKGQEMLVQSEKLACLRKLISDMAHEINNPLMVISGRAELSLMDELDDGIRENFKTIAAQCARIKEMIRKLLIFSKPGKGSISAVNINDLIDAVMSVEQPSLPVGITITKNYGSSLPNIKIDDKQIKEVFLNLLRNSVEAMPEGGMIAISTSKENNNIRIDFKDSGRGIAQEDMKKIFDPFFTTKENGAGLGLSMCYGIAKIHHGELRYESAPGQGTTATLILPVGEQGAANVG
jgi:two-component system NtrC family sensor kinase